MTPAANTGEGTGLRVAAEAYRLGIEAQMCGRRPKVRVLGLAVAGMLALAAPIAGHAAPLGSSIKQVVPAPGIIQVWGGCGSGWNPVSGHWSRWRGGGVPPHCALSHYYGWWGPYGGWDNAYGWGGRYGPEDDWGALWYPYRGWRGPSRGWGNP